MPLQMRPGSPGRPPSDERYYSPDRDIAWCFQPLAAAAVNGMRRDHWEPWYGEYLAATGTTEQDVARACMAMCKASTSFLDTKITEPAQALEAAGFFATPKPAQLAVAAKLGQVMLGAFFTAIRDVHQVGQKPINQSDMDYLVQAAERFLFSLAVVPHGKAEQSEGSGAAAGADAGSPESPPPAGG